MEMGIINPHLGYRIDFRMFGVLIRIKGGYAVSFAALMIIHQRCSPFISISRKLEPLPFSLVEYGSVLHDQYVAHAMTNGVKEDTCALLTDSQQEIGVLGL